LSKLNPGSSINNLLNLKIEENDDKSLKEFDREFEAVNQQEQLKDDLDNANKAIQSVDNISFINLNSHFSNHSLIADKINSMDNLSWKAST